MCGVVAAHQGPAELVAARKLLAECYVLSGADPDGNTVESGWEHLWPNAVREVAQLRADYNELSEEADDERKRAAELRRVLGNERGEGAGPSTGWVSTSHATGPRWVKYDSTLDWHLTVRHNGRDLNIEISKRGNRPGPPDHALHARYAMERADDMIAAAKEGPRDG